MKKITFFMLISTFVLFLNSCQEESIINSLDPKLETEALKSFSSIEKEMKDYDKNISQFAEALAKSLKNKNLRVQIKKEALLKIDGDFDIIWKDFKNNKIKLRDEEIAIIELLADSTNFEGKDKNKSLEELTNFGEGNKKLQIAVPVHCSDWEEDNFIPLVAFQTSNYSEQDETIKAYDSKGKLHLLDNKIAPDFPVIVINLNERSDLNGNILDEYKQTKIKSVTLEDYPNAPTNFTSSFNMNGVYLTWNYQWDYQYYDQIELEKLTSGTYQILNGYPKPAYVSSEIDTEANNPGSEYYYRIRIKREYSDQYGNTQILYSPYTTTYVQGTNLEPNKPGELYIGNLAPDNIELRWGQPSSSSYTGFKLYRRRPGYTDYALIATLNSNVYYYIDQNLEGKGLKYHYYVVAFNDAGNSEPVWEVTYNPYRNENEKLVVTRFEISNYTKYESWSNAGPEVRFSLAAAESPSSTQTNLLVSKETIPVVEDGPTPEFGTTTIRKWKVSNSLGYYEALRNWDNEFFASILTINCYENDASWLGKVKFSFSTKIPVKIDETATIESTFGGNIELTESQSKEIQFGTDWLYFWDPEIIDLTLGADLTLHFETLVSGKKLPGSKF